MTPRTAGPKVNGLRPELRGRPHYFPRDRTLIPVEVDPAVQPFGNLAVTWTFLGFLLLLNLWMHLRRRQIRRAEAIPEEG